MEYKYMLCEQTDIDYIEEKLERYNENIAPSEREEAEEIYLKVLDNNQNIIAGCNMYITKHNICDIDILWVQKSYRGQSIGSLLIFEAEKIIREKGCDLAILGTFEFQAKGFYQKMGYTLFDEQEDHPNGYKHYSFKKVFNESYKPIDRKLNKEFSVQKGSKEDGKFVLNQLVEYNSGCVPRKHQYETLAYKFISDEKEFVGAISAGVSGWDVAYIDTLFIEEKYRLKGFGTSLLKHVEEEAKKKGATSIFGDAFDWQLEFFLKNNYRITGKLEDCPKGHIWYSLKKDLS